MSVFLVISAGLFAVMLGFLFHSVYVIGHCQGYIDALNEHAKPAIEDWKTSLGLWKNDIDNFRQHVASWEPPSGGPGDD
jgi:hypothetical protein